MRQRRFRNKKKKQQEEEQEIAETPGQLGIDIGKIDEVQWKNAYARLPRNLPVYQTGKLIECPEQLQGDNAMAAMMLLGLNEYLQESW